MTDLWRGTTALITGASRGIGAAFARLLAERGVNLVLVARGAEALEQVATEARARGVTAVAMPLDLADPTAPSRLVEMLNAQTIVVDHLINNAGVGSHGEFQSVPAERHLPTIDVNIRAVTDLTARLLPGMIERRRGGVINIASTAAWQGLKWLPVYAASKAYVVNFSEGLWVTLRGTGVRCVCVSPGPVDTPFFDANDLTSRPPKWLMQSAETVAARGLRAYERDDCHTITFLPFRLGAWGTRLAPRALAARLGAFYAVRAR